jgi:hypothetical protein
MIGVGAHVRITGESHPHSGKTGVVTEMLGVFTIGPPRCVIKLDDGPGFIVVSLPNLTEEESNEV